MKTHNFHFLINKKLKTDINNIEELKKYSFSGKLNFILIKIDKFSSPQMYHLDLSNS